jgi:hypothetical protein
MKTETKLWIGLGILMILTPLGLIAQGTAWGEWAAEEIKEMLGFTPAGLERVGSLWSAPMPDYSLPGWDEQPVKASMVYILSAVVGVGVIVAAIFGLGKLLASREEKR